MNRSDYKRLGNYIREVDVRNRDLAVTQLVGLTIDKAFIPSVANVIGTDLSNYKVIRNKQFACSLMQVSRDQKIPVAIFKGTEAIMSPAYPMFEVIDEQELMPEYLMMWFARKEFDREASFYAVGGVRGSLTWEDFTNMTLPVPSIERQRAMVAEYETLSRRIGLNRSMIAQLEATAQTLYRKMFVDDIDPEHLPAGWQRGTIKDLGNVIGGATPQTGNASFWCDNGIRWLSPADLSKQGMKFISKGAKDITELGYKSCSTKLLPAGSVLFSSRAPIGLMAINTQELCTNQGFKSIVPHSNIGTAYVYYYLHSIKDKIAEENEGSTFNEVSGQNLQAYSAIIPPDNLCKVFSKKIAPIFRVQNNVEQEIRLLTELQSLLLAKMGQ